MSAQGKNANSKTRRITPPEIRLKKKASSPLVCLTAYTAPIAHIIDQHCDLILVGDSLGMVIYGMDSTLPVTLEMMCQHGKAVVDHTSKACIVIDMPFGSYQESPEQAFRNCAKVLIETGAAAVKLEGGKELAETIKFLTQRGIPVLAHIGLTPQYYNTLGGYKVQGKTDTTSEKLLKDAVAVSQAGAFGVVIEGTIESVSNEITNKIEVPTIGIGASAECDGQILVIDDMLGMSINQPAKFVKKYANISEQISQAAAEYAKEVQSRSFPAKEHVYTSKK